MKTYNKIFPCQYEHNALRFVEKTPKQTLPSFLPGLCCRSSSRLCYVFNPLWACFSNESKSRSSNLVLEGDASASLFASEKEGCAHVHCCVQQGEEGVHDVYYNIVWEHCSKYSFCEASKFQFMITLLHCNSWPAVTLALNPSASSVCGGCVITHSALLPSQPVCVAILFYEHWRGCVPYFQSATPGPRAPVLYKSQ